MSRVGIAIEQNFSIPLEIPLEIKKKLNANDARTKTKTCLVLKEIAEPFLEMPVSSWKNADASSGD